MKSFPIDWRRVLLILGVFFLTLVIVEFNSRLEELERLNRKVEVARAEATQAAFTQVALEALLEIATSDQVVEEQARNEGHMIQEGDHPVIIIGDGSETPLNNSAPILFATPKPNWQSWWDLYFGEE